MLIALNKKRKDLRLVSKCRYIIKRFYLLTLKGLNNSIYNSPVYIQERKVIILVNLIEKKLIIIIVLTLIFLNIYCLLKLNKTCCWFQSALVHRNISANRSSVVSSVHRLWISDTSFVIRGSVLASYATSWYFLNYCDFNPTIRNLFLSSMMLINHSTPDVTSLALCRRR